MLHQEIKPNQLVAVLKFDTETKTSQIKFIGRVITINNNIPNTNHVFLNVIENLENTNFLCADVLIRQKHFGITIPYKKVPNIQEFVLPLFADFTEHEAFKNYSIDKVQLNNFVAHFINLEDNRTQIRINQKFPSKPIITTRKRNSLKYRLMNCLKINLPTN